MGDKKKKEKAECAPLQIVFEQLMSRVHDQELQKTYDGMVANIKSWKETYNAYVLQFHELRKEKEKLEQALLSVARQGLQPFPEILELDKKLDKKAEFLVEKIEEAKKNFENDEAICAKYRSITETRLFTYWQILKALDESLAPWLEFKTAFDNIIF